VIEKIKRENKNNVVNYNFDDSTSSLSNAKKIQTKHKRSTGDRKEK